MQVDPLMSDSQRGLYGVLNVVAINKLMNAQALLADGVKKGCCIARQDLADGVEAQHRVQASDACGKFVGRTASTRVLDRLNGLTHGFDRITDGMGKIAIEQQELQNAVWC